MPDSEGEGKTTRLGGFELLERIGQGGMGTVYRARQVSMNRVVALKILPPKLAKDHAFVERFVREARSAARLAHPNIVQGIDVGQAGGTYYFAMEFVDGPTVRQLIEREGRLDEKRALEIVRGVALALEHAHERGIIHRDIKPDNLMLAADGAVKLADLGLARSVEKPTSITIEGTALGTPYYMAPEQIRGLPDIDTRADIYALGATLYHMVTGAFPYDGPSATAIVTKHITDPVPSARDANPNVSRACDELIGHMMAKEPDDRPQTPTELLAAIDDALAGKVHLRVSAKARTRTLVRTGPAKSPTRRKTPAAPRDVGGASLPRVRRSKTLAWATAAGGALLLALVLTILLWPGGGGTQPPPTDPGEAALEQADAWAKAHPTDYDAAIARYQAILDQHRGTRPAAIAPGRIETLRKRKADGARAKAAREAEAAFPQYRRTARDLAADDCFGDALDFIQAFCDHHEALQGADAVAELKAEIRQRAEQRYEEVAAAADAAVAEKDYKTAIEALRAVEGFRLHELWERARAKLEEICAAEKSAGDLADWLEMKAGAEGLAATGRLDMARKVLEAAKAIPLDDIADRVAETIAALEDARQERLDAALAAYRPSSEKFWALLKDRQYAEARRFLTEATKDLPELASVQQASSADWQAVGLLRLFWAAVEEGLKLRVGQFLAFGGEGGTITAVRNGQVTLKTPKGEATLPIVKLGAKQALTYVLLKDDARSHLTKGVFLLAEQTELDEAAQALASAGDAPHLAHYRDRLDALRLGAAEVAARRAWSQIQRYAKGKLTKSRAARLPSALDAFAAQHGNTNFAASVQRQLTALRGRLAGAGEGWVSLFDGKSLRGWRVMDEGTLFAGHGEVTVRDNAINLEQGANRTAIAWKADFPSGDYEVRGEAMRTRGSNSFCTLVLPVARSRCCLVIGGGGKGRPGTGLEWLDGRSFNHNPTYRRLSLPSGKWHTINVRVKGSTVRAWVDGKEVLACDTANYNLTIGSYAAVVPFGISTGITTGAAIRRIEVRRLGPEAEPRGEAPKASKWQSLFDGKSLRGWKIVEEGVFARHGRVGVRDGRILLERGGPKTAIARSGHFPTVDYELAIEAMRIAGDGDFCDIIFPAGTDQGVLYVGGWGGGTVGLAIDGHGANNNVTTRNLKLQNGRWYRLRLRVTEARIRFWLDDEPLIDLDGAEHKLNQSVMYAPLKPLGLQAHATSAALRNIRLRRLGPEAEPRGEDMERHR